MKKPRLYFPPGSLITHLYLKRGISTALKKSVRDHMQAEIGDYLVIRAVAPGIVMVEKLSPGPLDENKENLLAQSYISRVPSSLEEGVDK